jgi:hypothetical protein
MCLKRLEKCDNKRNQMRSMLTATASAPLASPACCRPQELWSDLKSCGPTSRAVDGRWGAATYFEMGDQAPLPRVSSGLHVDDGAAQKACMAFPGSIRAKVSTMLRAQHEEWANLSWARKLELVQAQAVSLRAASAAAFESLLSSTARPDFGRDLPSCPDVILSCAASSEDFCLTLEAAEKPHRSPIHCIVVLDVSGSMDHSAAQTAPGSSQESQLKFSRLDLAKHSSKVIIEVMGDDDHVTIISFGSEANEQLQKTRTTQAGAFGLRPSV